MQAMNELDFTDVQHEICINPDEIAGYVIRRSPASRLHFNVFGVDHKEELLFCAASDIDFEAASAYVDALNKEYYPVVPSPTEAAFIEIGGESKVYNITAK